MFEVIGMLEARLLVAMIPALICLPIVVLLLNMFVMPFLKNKALSKAWQDGHVVDGKLIDKKDLMASVDDDSNEQYTYLKYEYYYNGKRYVYSVRTIYDPTVTYEKKLYFKRNPKKAKAETDFGGVENKCKVYWVLVLLFFVVTLVMV